MLKNIQTLRNYVRGRGNNPFGREPTAQFSTYLALHEKEKARLYEGVDRLETSFGYSISKKWLDDLALRTQVVVKKSDLNWQHGRLLYATLRKFLAERGSGGQCVSPVFVFETGTARGFSALCMAKALLDARHPGAIVTVDPLPHLKPMFWNCIADHEGKLTREQLISGWSDEMERIIFLEGRSESVTKKVVIPRIHFAFLDAQHNFAAVMKEFSFVSERQLSGDRVFFDDVTAGSFDGVVEAVNSIKKDGVYDVTFFEATSDRGYALAVRN